MKESDARVVAAMGDKFAQFQAIARKAYRADPATRQAAEREMAALLETMSPVERVDLRRALIAARRG